MSPNAKSLSTVRQFQSEIAAIREQDEPFSARLTLYSLTAMVVVFILVAALTTVDRTVSSFTGKIITQTGTTDYQPLDTSIVKSIDVKEGERVTKGQLLATLDSTFTSADLNQIRDQIDSLEAQIAREEAEISGSEPIFPGKSGAGLGKYVALQQQLFEQRRAQYQAQINSFDQKIATTQATIKKFEVDESHFKDREAIAKQIEDMRSTLMQKGAGSLLNLLGSSDSRIEMLRTLDFGHNSLIEAQHQLSSLQADREAFIQQWLSTTSQDLVTARITRDAARNQLDKAQKHQDLVKLYANQDSYVLQRAKINIGSIVKEGDILVTLAPVDAPLEAEAEITTRDVGFIRVGDEATLKIDAFNVAEHGTVAGRVATISEGAFTTDDTGTAKPPFYKIRVRIESVNLINVPPSFRLIPGMTLTTDVKVGTRSLGAYILGGLVESINSSMREP